MTEPTGQDQSPATTFTAFWLFRATDRVYQWSEDGRRLACEAALRVLADHEPAVRLRAAYTTAGLSAGVDFILWVIADEAESFQHLAADLRRPPVGAGLELRHAYLGVASASQYDPNHGPAFLRGVPPKRYLSVYPFTKTPSWYLLPFEQRRDLMIEHGRIGRNSLPSSPIPSTPSASPTRSSSLPSRTTTPPPSSRWSSASAL